MTLHYFKVVASTENTVRTIYTLLQSHAKIIIIYELLLLEVPLNGLQTPLQMPF